MSFVIRGRLDGIAEARRNLQHLGEQMRKRILRKAVRAAAKLIEKAAKSHADASKDTGLLKKSIGTVVRVYRGGDKVIAVIGPRVGFRRVIDGRVMDPTKYAHLVENGVKPHALGKGSSLRKKTQAGQGHPGFAAKPFLRPAIDGNKAAANAAIARVVAEELKK